MDTAKITLLAPAKINLYLGITSLRADGYHDIETVMQSVGLFDSVTVETFRADYPRVNVQCSGLQGVSPETNTAYKAAIQYLKAAGIDDTAVNITIQKNIPDGAGLGGGSSDAAAVLLALNSVNGGLFTTERLCDIGAGVGADVPFCVKKGTVKATGIGEITENCAPMPDCGILIVMPRGVKISTAAAYAAVGDGYPSEFEKMLAAVEKRDIFGIAAAMKNDFERIMDKQSPSVLIKRRLLSLGAVGAQMSGSGAAVFGIFETLADAERARAKLGGDADSFVCAPVQNDRSYIPDAKKKKAIRIKQPQSSCESCEFFIYDEELDDYVCDISLDEDEMADYMGRHTGSCPYYRFYDEYKSVQKQN